MVCHSFASFSFSFAFASRFCFCLTFRLFFFSSSGVKPGISDLGVCVTTTLGGASSAPLVSSAAGFSTLSEALTGEVMSTNALQYNFLLKNTFSFMFAIRSLQVDASIFSTSTLAFLSSLWTILS